MSSPRTIAFVCLHGSAKSLIAAEYLNRRARERGLRWTGTTSGPEPDASVPANVIEGLRRQGIDATSRVPERVTAAALRRAAHIVSFACDAPRALAPEAAVEAWDDCPAVSEDFEIAWRFITGHVDRLLERLAAEG